MPKKTISDRQIGVTVQSLQKVTRDDIEFFALEDNLSDILREYF